MSRRYRDSENPVSLFPFLAVLICAMGVLIFLLIVSTSRIRSQMMQQAQQREETEKPKRTEKPELVTIATTRVFEHLPNPAMSNVPRRRTALEHTISQPKVDPNVQLRNQLLAIRKKLDEERVNRNHLQAALNSENRKHQRLETDILSERKQLETTEDDLQKRLQRVEQLSTKKNEVGREVYFLKRNINEQNRKRAQAAAQFEIVPFEGRTGTTRRPILIECRENGMTFLPEGITLSIANLEGFTARKNPLLSAVNTLVSYWHREDKMKSGNPNEPLPYVLLLVRPSGSLSFYAARRMLSQLDVPFGYELIEEDWKFAMPSRDNTATQIAQEAIRKTVRQGRFLTRSHNNGLGSLQNEFVATDGRRIRFDKRSGTFEVVGSDKSSGRGTASQSRNGKTGTSSNDSSERFGPRRNFDERAGRGSSSTVPRSQRGFPRNQSNSIGEPRRLKDNSQYQGSKIGTGSESNRNRPENRQNAFPNSTSESKDGAQWNGSASTRKSYKENNTYGQNLNNGRSDGLSNFERRRRTKESRRQNGNGSARNSKSDFEQEFFNSAQNRSSSRNKQRSSTTNSRGSRGNQSSSGSSFANSNLMPIPHPFSSQKSNSSSSQTLRSKSRWGFSSFRASIGFEREVTIRVSDKFAKIGKGDFFAVSPEKNNSNNIKLFIDSVEKHVRSWGHPPERFYWIPSIRLVVLPGGMQNAARLKSLAENMRLPAKIDLSSAQIEHQPGSRIDEK